jgi:hypothetical protein
MDTQDWIDGGQPLPGATIRYSYAFGSGTNFPRPFDSTYGANAKLVLRVNAAITKYTGSTNMNSNDPVCYSNTNLYLRDSANQKFFIIVGRIFGFGNNYLKEKVTRLGTSEMSVSTYFGNAKTGTVTATKIYSSSASGTNLSQSATSTTTKHFAYEVNRSQFSRMITDMNSWLTANNQSSTLYSTTLEDYQLTAVNIGIECARLNNTSYPKIAFIGNNLKVSTIYDSP